jgi:threonylcarbamoyladenosine tRNA methylthiotransferase MtaB
MGRRYDSATYAGIVARARSAIPGLAVHADVITGFPTEDDAAFERSAAFVASLELAGLHVFRYSGRPGTPAIRMAGQVPEAVRRERSARLLELGATARAHRAAGRVGSVAAVLVESRLGDGRWVGHAEDGIVVAIEATTPLLNAIVTAALSGVDPGQPDRVIGRVIEVSAGRPLRGRSTAPLPTLAAGGAA